MADILEYKTENGTVKFEVERSDFTEDSYIASPAGGATESLKILQSKISFDDALDILDDITNAIHKKIETVASKPETISVSFGLKLKGSAGFIIAKAGAESEMKITLTW